MDCDNDCPVHKTDLTAADEGYMLVAVVVLVALVLIALSVAAPVVAKSIRHDKELESERRAQEYVRAIRLYYRKTHAYPPSLDALKQTSNVRFLRHEYVDPLTGKSDWRIIHLGEQKTTVKGFFGQELGGIASSGLGSAAGLGSGVGTPIGGTSQIGATSPLASGFGGATVANGAGGATGSPGTSAGLAGGGFGTGFGSSGTSGSTGASGSTGSSGGIGGGGGAIIGVGTAKTGNSIATPNQQATYEAWEFWYDPRIEQLYQKGHMNAGVGGGALGSQPASGFGSGLNGQPNTPGGANGVGGSTLGSGFGSGSGPGTGTGPTTPSTPSTPQQ